MTYSFINNAAESIAHCFGAIGKRFCLPYCHFEPLYTRLEPPGRRLVPLRSGCKALGSGREALGSG
ncbi:hypothetical protein KEM09_15165 [Carboxylicivirga mesophila]|uniref:Uncharacterized protein n=1 Tax=Carboxylicivirga mesophila TaxID=1166478 RepID=A0ABS5KCN9_9BACT|nr:hypothetical protein [Carboxylicivirga mesophila]MBS2212758.1 hypothetical protein [Carboxylicivirga mesophila]